MFGGIDVDIPLADVTELREVLLHSTDGGAGSRLQDLVGNAALAGKPWQDGHHLAEDLLDDLEELEFDMLADGHMSITRFCCEFGMEVVERKLDADSSRGVALAGVELTPAMVVNESSPCNQNGKGRRFAVAHELCHVLHDQGRAQGLARISGPRAHPAVEQRANAFAAWMLMP